MRIIKIEPGKDVKDIGEQRCYYCIFARAYLGKLLCRKNPPVVIVSDNWGDEGSITVWPKINNDDWCGEWKEKEEG